MTTPTPAHSLRDTFKAISMWRSSFAYLKQKNLRHYHAAGPIVVIGLAAAGVFLSRWLTHALQTTLHEKLQSAGWGSQSPSQTTASAWWNEALNWGSSTVDSLIEWGVILLVLTIKIKIIKYLLITLMTPAMSALSSDIKSAETGHKTRFLWSGLIRDILRGARISIVLLVMELALGLALWITGLSLTLFIGPLMVIASPLLLIASWTVGAYFFGAAVYDAVYEQDGLDWKTSLRMGWKQRSHLLGLGAIFSLVMAIPWAGPYLAAILGPVPCTTAAARLYFRPTSIETS